MNGTPVELSILIADDHKLILDVLGAYLSKDGDMAVTTAASLQEAVEKMAETGGFDVVLLDLDMPGMNGGQGVASAIEANAGKPVVLFSGDVPDPVLQDALATGAMGLFPKTLPIKTLKNAIRFVAAGETYMPPSYLTKDMRAEAGGENPLTNKEMIVLRGLCLGKANKEIAREMTLSDVTIKMHVRSICAKLGAANRTQAAMIARQRRLA